MNNSFYKTKSDWGSQSRIHNEGKFIQFIDPFLRQGGQIIYDEDHDFVVRMQQKPNQFFTLKQLQNIRVKILMTEFKGICKNIRVELTSDDDMYFNFVFSCSDYEFKRIKENQNMFIEFKQYPQVVIKSFIRLKKQKQTQTFRGMITVYSQKEGRLEIIRRSQFRDDPILEFDFFKPADQQVRQSIQFRYNILRREYEQNSQKYEQLTSIVKAKNPSLMLNLNRSMKIPVPKTN